MTVAVLADAPTLTTGFGRTTRHIASALTAAGHDVHCFGLKAVAADVPPGGPFRIWPAEQGGKHWSASMPRFIAETDPDVVLLNMDAYNAPECVDVIRGTRFAGPIVSYVCFDGLPVPADYLNCQRSCASVWATSSTGAAYLRSERIEVAGIAPPGVDPSEFRPLAERDQLRRTAGFGDRPVIGVFATNTERKQIGRAVHGFADAVRRLPDRDLLLYLHCSPEGAEDLPRLSRQHGVEHRLVFAAHEAGSLDERRGVVGSGHGLGYVERMNCCDLVLNVAHSGDIEQAIIEAQACGVPVAATSDDGIMSEALGGAGIPLESIEVAAGRIGQRLHFVDPSAIADAICVVVNDETRRADLRRRGLENAARYPWSTLEGAACRMVTPFVSGRRSDASSSR